MDIEERLLVLVNEPANTTDSNLKCMVAGKRREAGGKGWRARLLWVNFYSEFVVLWWTRGWHDGRFGLSIVGWGWPQAPSRWEFLIVVFHIKSVGCHGHYWAMPPQPKTCTKSSQWVRWAKKPKCRQIPKTSIYIFHFRWFMVVIQHSSWSSSDTSQGFPINWLTQFTRSVLETELLNWSRTRRIKVMVLRYLPNPICGYTVQGIEDAQDANPWPRMVLHYKWRMAVNNDG